MSKLRKLWEAWKAFAYHVANIQARILLAIVYVLAVAPVAIIARLFHDPLRLRERPENMWIVREQASAPSFDEARRLH